MVPLILAKNAGAHIKSSRRGLTANFQLPGLSSISDQMVFEKDHPAPELAGMQVGRPRKKRWHFVVRTSKHIVVWCYWPFPSLQSSAHAPPAARAHRKPKMLFQRPLLRRRIPRRRRKLPSKLKNQQNLQLLPLRKSPAARRRATVQLLPRPLSLLPPPRRLRHRPLLRCLLGIPPAPP